MNSDYKQFRILKCLFCTDLIITDEKAGFYNRLNNYTIKLCSHAGLFDRYLLLLDTCHVCFPLTVSKCEISQRSCHCLFSYQFKTCPLHSHDSFILDKQTSDLCVDSSCHFVCQLVRVAKHKSHGNVFTMTRQTFSKCALIEVFAH